MQNDFLSVELVIHHHLHIILLFFDVNRHVDTVANDCKWDRFSVVLVLEEEGQ